MGLQLILIRVLTFTEKLTLSQLRSSHPLDK
ncbi:hypothetical protein SRABI80_00636 [Peribacillus frigoritolerans]|nr:hypothetical protein SRABI80_00636 [Peribacillus frigoritolerans]